MCPCLGLGLFTSYQYDLFFIFNSIFTVINHITSFKRTYLMETIVFKQQTFSLKVWLSFCFFCQFKSGVAHKRFALKKAFIF